MPSIKAANSFLNTLNKVHPSLHFTMEVATQNRLPFLGMVIEKKGRKLTTSVYHKPTSKGLLLHYQSHMDHRYKTSLLKTLLNRAYRLSTSWELFTGECNYLKDMFTKLRYPDGLINIQVFEFSIST